PKLQLRLQLSDQVADVFRDPVDIAFRLGRFDNASYVALPLLLGNRRVLAASPDYLARHGTPDSLDALKEHHCLLYQL
ncbi:LysR family transcriptional regulator, partial [Mycobacterium tuberculosis]